MKVYKLKEEVKKYLPKSLHEKKLQLASWDAIGKNQDIESLITGEAIEEVESIKVIKTKTQQAHSKTQVVILKMRLSCLNRVIPTRC